MTEADWDEAVRRVVAVAEEHAEDVDRTGRFPAELIAVCRATRVLGAPIPAELGGRGLSIAATCALVERVGRVCSSSGMILAMHFSQLYALLRHGRNAYLEHAIARCADEQHLLASATTEIAIGGDTRHSDCAVTEAALEGRIALHKVCPVISYGRYADAIVVTARRSEHAAGGDQVAVFVPRSEYRLTRISEWDALGMRGTCSEGFELGAETTRDGVLTDPFDIVSTRTMLPAAHCLWASVWLGMASGAAALARTRTQSAARRTPGSPPPSALRMAELELSTQAMADLVGSAVARFEAAAQSPELLDAVPFTIAMNTLKVAASTLVRQIVADCAVIIGIQAYTNGSPMSLGRLYRDSLAPSVMVNNDRILLNTSRLQLVARGAR